MVCEITDNPPKDIENPVRAAPIIPPSLAEAAHPPENSSSDETAVPSRGTETKSLEAASEKTEKNAINPESFTADSADDAIESAISAMEALFFCALPFFSKYFGTKLLCLNLNAPHTTADTICIK